jgi:hypothetical protein
MAVAWVKEFDDIDLFKMWRVPTRKEMRPYHENVCYQ